MLSKVILYLRVSSDKQLKGYSIEAQERRLKEFCEQNNFGVVKIIRDEGKSASIKDDKRDIRINNNKLIINYNLNQRPGFKWILDNCNKGIFNKIIIYKYDRFSRDVVFAKLTQQYLKDKGIDIIPSDDSQDPLASSITQIISEDEIRKLKERVRNVRMQRFKEGMMVGRMPIGYRLKNRKIVVDKVKARMIEDIFYMTLQGKSYKEICNKHKIKPQTYYNIIRNKVYIGIISFEGVEKIGVHEPIISKELFEKCQ